MGLSGPEQRPQGPPPSPMVPEAVSPPGVLSPAPGTPKAVGLQTRHHQALPSHGPCRHGHDPQADVLGPSLSPQPCLAIPGLSLTLVLLPGPDPARQRQRTPHHGLSLGGLPTLREQPALAARWHVGVAAWVDEANTMYYYTKRAFFWSDFLCSFLNIVIS